MKAPNIEQPQREATASTFESGKTIYRNPDYLDAIAELKRYTYYQESLRKGFAPDPTWWNKQYFKK